MVAVIVIFRIARQMAEGRVVCKQSDVKNSGAKICNWK
jgi:hypothetical protein